MKKKKLHFFLLILLASLVLTGCTQEDEEVEDITETLVSIGDSQAQPREKEVEVIPDFTSAEQEIGESSEKPYSLTHVRDTEMPGFHRIVFEIEGEEEPNVVASYDDESTSIHLVFNSLMQDDAQLGDDGNLDINRDCVLGVMRLDSDEENVGMYRVRLSDFEAFRLYGQELDESSWSVFLDIQYLGLEEEEEEVIESDSKTIGDAVASDGARIVSYYYEIDQNVFRFVWGSRTSESESVPEVKGRHNADGDIIIVFPDLESDYIAIDAHEIELSGIIKGISWSRTDGESIYKFDLQEKRDFELKSDADSDEVILEITLW